MVNYELTVSIFLLVTEFLLQWKLINSQNILFFQMNKQTERMYYLLAICLVLHPQRIDESVLSTLKENYGDKLLKMQRGYVNIFFT